jgi:fatty acid desaturase
MPPNAEAVLRDRSHITVRKPGTKTEYDQEVLINGNWYNVEEFAKRHPGGRILNFYRGKDATEAFNEFHNRSIKAKKMLKTMKHRPDEGKSQLLGTEVDPLVRDFTILRGELEKEGFFKPSIPHVALRIAELVAMHAIGFWLLSTGYTMAGLTMLGVAQGRCGWFMHEGGHCSLTGNIPTDIAIQVFFYGTGCGMSAAFWRNQHNKHHATPQKIDHDVDLDTLPLVMFHTSVKDGKQKNLLNKPWIRLQGYLFAPVSCLLVSMGWTMFLHPRHSLRTGRYHELASMALRYAVVAYTGSQLEATVGSTILSYLFYVWVGSAYIFCNFAVSHTHKPVIQANEDVSWVRYSSDHTMNVSSGMGKWVDWWMSYLNYQIEHHLFPSMPQFRHPEVSPRVKKLFAKHGVEYDQMDYWPAMWKTFKNLDQVGRDVWYG